MKEYSFIQYIGMYKIGVQINQANCCLMCESDNSMAALMEKIGCFYC